MLLSFSFIFLTSHLWAKFSFIFSSSSLIYFLFLFKVCSFAHNILHNLWKTIAISIPRMFESENESTWVFCERKIQRDLSSGFLYLRVSVFKRYQRLPVFSRTLIRFFDFRNFSFVYWTNLSSVFSEPFIIILLLFSLVFLILFFFYFFTSQLIL